jgi:hypothetical protein
MNTLLLFTPWLGIVVFLILIWWDMEKKKHETPGDVFMSFFKITIVTILLLVIVALVVITFKWALV